MKFNEYIVEAKKGLHPDDQAALDDKWEANDKVKKMSDEERKAFAKKMTANKSVAVEIKSKKDIESIGKKLPREKTFLFVDAADQIKKYPQYFNPKTLGLSDKPGKSQVVSVKEYLKTLS
jgi:hypothetical protein